MTAPITSVHAASERLMQTLRQQFGITDVAANDPLVRAIVEYGDRERARDDAGVHAASEHLYAELTHHFGPRDLGAHEPFVEALTTYGQACRAEGPRF